MIPVETHHRMHEEAARPAVRRRDGEQVVLARVEDLGRLWQARGDHRRVTVLLALPLDLDEARRARLERRINRSLAACGCGEGTIAGLLYLILAPTVVMGHAVPHTAANWALAALGLLGALLLGKAAGLAYARVRLLWAMIEINRIAGRRTKGS